ncbi:MAG: hypothetical protein Fur0021_15890 [Candidatus Promineifilaceae bacterium]
MEYSHTLSANEFQPLPGPPPPGVDPLPPHSVRKSNMNPIKLQIMDEHPAVRQALEVRLRSSAHLNIVAVDDNLTAALHHTHELAPDIVLLGLKSTRKLSPYLLADVVKQLVAAHVGVIVLTSYEDVVEREVLLQAGANRYLLKNINSSRLIAELETVAKEIHAH